MLTNLTLLIVDAVLGFFTLMLLARFFMQWTRVSFRNQFGQFVVQVTDWLVLPLRRLLSGPKGLDLSSLAPAFLLQALGVGLALALRGHGYGANPIAIIGTLLLVGMLETIKLSLYLLITAVIVQAVLSWVNPYAPLAPLVNAITAPFLRPIQKVLPTIANVDLSPLVLLLILQIALMVLAHLRGLLLPIGV